MMDRTFLCCLVLLVLLGTGPGFDQTYSLFTRIPQTLKALFYLPTYSAFIVLMPTSFSQTDIQECSYGKKEQVNDKAR